MSESSQAIKLRPADLRALRRQLEEVAAKTRMDSDAIRNRIQVAGPTYVVRGK